MPFREEGIDVTFKSIA
jgi:hypothetical protein